MGMEPFASGGLFPRMQERADITGYLAEVKGAGFKQLNVLLLGARIGNGMLESPVLW